MIIAISSLDNVRRQWTSKAKKEAEETAEWNFTQTLRTGAAAGVVTETFFAWVKRGIYAAAPDNIRFQTEPGQSVMTWCDTDQRIPSHQHSFNLHGRLPGHWDKRDAQVMLLTDPDTKQAEWLVGEHTAPLKRIPFVYRAGQRAHRQAVTATEHFVNSHPGFPTNVAGDLNWAKRLFPSADGRLGPGITHLEWFNSIQREIQGVSSKTFKLISNHPGVLVETR